MQSESTAQLPLHAVAPQTYAPHDCVCVAGHAPTPLHEAWSVATPALHDASRHVADPPGYAQAVRAVPSHAPPQTVPSVEHAVRAPWGAPLTAAQVPALPGTSQASHSPLQATLQQTPSTQFPFAHCAAAEQLDPSPSLTTQTPAEHQSPAGQSASTAQLPLQAVGPQEYGEHACVCSAGQWPLPSHDAPRVATPAVQDAPRQDDVGYAQAVALVPSQLPPQAEPSLAQAARVPCGAPVTSTQLPTLPPTSHASHWPLQAWLQQKPSAQWPLVHWLESVQAEPSASLPTHWPLEQYEPAAQSPSTVQVVLHAVAPQP